MEREAPSNPKVADRVEQVNAGPQQCQAAEELRDRGPQADCVVHRAEVAGEARDERTPDERRAEEHRCQHDRGQRPAG